jgi:transposase
VVERSFSWIANYRRLNTIFERTKDHLVAFIEIAFVSIGSRRIKRLVAEEASA